MSVATTEIPALIRQTSRQETSRQKREERRLQAETEVNNGATMIRIDSILIVFCNVFFCSNAFTMVGIGGDNDLEDDEFSPTMFVLAMITLFCLIVSIWDCHKTFRGTQQSDVVLSWEWQHSGAKRVASVFLPHTLIMLPTLLTFVLHSRGDNFFDLLEHVDSSFARLVIYHFVSWFILLVVCLLTVLYAKYTINGPTTRKKIPILEFREVALWKLLALSITILTIGHAVGCIEATDRELNSGVIVSTIIFLIAALVVLQFSVGLIAEHNRSVLWYDTYRTAIAALIFVSYLTFWGILLLLVFDSTGVGSGWWSTVNDLDSERKTMVYFHLGVFIFYLLCCLHRIFFHKMRKKWRAPRIVQVTADGSEVDLLAAVPAEEPQSQGRKTSIPSLDDWVPWSTGNVVRENPKTSVVPEHHDILSAPLSQECKSNPISPNDHPGVVNIPNQGKDTERNYTDTSLASQQSRKASHTEIHVIEQVVEEP